VIIVRYVGQRPFGRTLIELEFSVVDRILGNAADRIFVYMEDPTDRIPYDFTFNARADYLLALQRISDPYGNTHEDGFLLIRNIIIDVDNPQNSPMYRRNTFEPSEGEGLNLGAGATRQQIVSYFEQVTRVMPLREERMIKSEVVEDIIHWSPYVLVVEIGRPSRLASEVSPSDWGPTDIFYATVIDVLDNWGYIAVGDEIEVIFVADTVRVGEQHIVATRPSSTGRHNFTSRHSLFSMDQLDEIIQILDSAPPPPPLSVLFHYDNQITTLPIIDGQINHSQIPTPATRYGIVGTPGQAHMGWFTELFPYMHYVNNPNRATPFDLTQPLTQDMADEHGHINLHASWLQYGDVDGDGTIANSDREQLQNFILGDGNPIHIQTADVNVDRRVDGIDRALLQSHLIGSPGVILGPRNPNMAPSAYVISYHFSNGVIDVPITNGRIDTAQISDAELLEWEMELLNALYTASQRGSRATGLTIYVADLISAELL